MFTPFLTLAFLAAAVLAAAVIAASLAKGFAAASSLRRQWGLCGDGRLVTIRHQRLAVIRGITPARASQRPARSPAVLPQRRDRRVAA